MSTPKDMLAGLVILVVCGYLFFLTTRFESDLFGMVQGMPATLMPRLLLGVIVFLTLIMLVQGYRAGAATALPLPPWRMWATVAILAAATILFEVIGVPLAFLAVCVIVPILWGARSYLRVGVFAVLLPLAIYIVFQQLLGLRLPLGPLAAPLSAVGALF